MSGGVASQQLDVLRTIRDLLHESLCVQVASFEELKAQGKILEQISDYLAPEPVAITASIAVKFTVSGEEMANNVLVFNVGQTAPVSIQPLLADGVSPSLGVLSGVSYTFNDPSATVVLNPDGLTAVATGVAASAGPVTGQAVCTVTDTDGAVSAWTQAFTIQTNAVVPPQQLTQSIAVVFGTPTP